VDKELGAASQQLSVSQIAELREARAAKRASVRADTPASSVGGGFDVEGERGGGGVGDDERGAGEGEMEVAQGSVGAE